MITENITQLNFFNDPGHGWLEVGIKELESLGIADKVSSYSYMKNGRAYLEEDCNASLLVRTLGFRPLYNDVYADNQSKVRNYQTYDYQAYLKEKKYKKDLATLKRHAKHEAYTSCGLVKVRGALGGVYYE